MQKILPFLVILLLVIVSACEDDSQNVTSKLPGTWHCQEKSAVFNSSYYDVEITRSTLNDNEILIDNFYHLGTGVKVNAYVSLDYLEIPEQTASGFLISGTGNITDNGQKITLIFTAQDNGGVDSVSAVLTRY